jgi:hypothetical protein
MSYLLRHADIYSHIHTQCIYVLCKTIGIESILGIAADDLKPDMQSRTRAEWCDCDGLEVRFPIRVLVRLALRAVSPTPRNRISFRHAQRGRPACHVIGLSRCLNRVRLAMSVCLVSLTAEGPRGRS